jgi:hypothetical protein
MQIIITCGFQSIDTSCLRKKKKGKIFDSEIVAIFYIPTNEQVQRQNFDSECF